MKLLKKLLVAILISSSLLIVAPTITPELPNSYIVEATKVKLNYNKKTLYVGNTKYKCKLTIKQRKTTSKSQTKSSTVYITKTGSKYHKSSCSYLRKSKITTSLKKAKSSGYTACSRCNP